MARTVLRRLTLRDFRSYAGATLELDGRPVALSGANGAGKTNLLEAVSYLAPGKGLRGASVAELGRRLPGEATGRAWSVAAVIEGPQGEVRLGTGLECVADDLRPSRGLSGAPQDDEVWGDFAATRYPEEGSARDRLEARSPLTRPPTPPSGPHGRRDAYSPAG